MTELEKVKLCVLRYLDGQDTEEELMSICGIVKCPECGQLVFEDELIDTEGMVNGGIGKVCEQCIEDKDIVDL